ncbi:MAG: hypothetical protein LH606_12835 [Cytophagaceae bacterium]|nr:hypothetical protein [Cytophagaceae bacterium]
MKNQADLTDGFLGTTATPRRSINSLFSDKKTTAIAMGTILAGGSALAWGMSGDGTLPPGAGELVSMDPPAPTEPVVTDQTLSVPNGTITPGDDIQIGIVNDGLSFEEAFQAARTQTGAGGVFAWHGQVYNTFQKEEWMGLSLAQRQEFVADLNFKPTPTNEPTVPGRDSPPVPSVAEPEPIIKDMLAGDQRVVGYDFDHDGMIDLIVMPKANGREVRIFDSEGGGNELDREVVIDQFTNEVIRYEKLPEPWAITNDGFEKEINQYNDSLPMDDAARETDEQPAASYVADTDDNDATDEDGTPDYQHDAENQL